MAQASRALVMLLPTPPLPDTTPITFLTLLLGLGASCCGAWRLAQSSPQLEQSWVHSSLILLFPAPKGGAASCIIQMIHAQGASPRSLPFYHTTKAAPLQGGAECFRVTLKRKWGPHRCDPHRPVFGRRGVLLHLSGFPCLYQRRVAATKLTTSNTGLIRQKGPRKPATGSGLRRPASAR